MFEPEPIADRKFGFSDELVASAFDIESKYIRIDERSARYEYSSSLRNSLARLEAISTASISGPVPDLRLMVWLLGKDLCRTGGSTVAQIPAFLVCSQDVVEATFVAFRYEKVLERIASSPARTHFSQSDFLAIHCYLAHGSSTSDNQDVRYRKQRFTRSKAGGEHIGETHMPPSPNLIPYLMDDLFRFIETPKMTPVMQACIAHFQLQAICPFRSAMDSTDRTLAQAVLHQRGFSQHIIPTIGFPLAAGFTQYVKLLMPYRYPDEDSSDSMQKCLERWIRHCLVDTRQSTQVVVSYMERLAKIIGSYKQRIGPYRQGSAVDVLIRELPGLPMFDTTIAMELTGKGHSAVSEALSLLVEKEVLRQIGNSQRNRLFEAPDILDMEQRILSNAIMPVPQAGKEPNL